MATRSTIWVTKTDGTTQGVYCHSDGYYSHNGEILLNHYASQEKAEYLVSLGGLSFLDKHPDPLEEAPSAYSWRDPAMLKAKDHKFGNRQEGVTVAYHRDRGEPLEIMTAGESGPLPEQMEEYNYWFRDGQWLTHENGIWMPLLEAMVLDNEDED